jgi:hypothetical protein
MEEKNKDTKKLSYEELEKAAVQLQQRAMMAENKLRGIDFASIRLNWLFKVLENKETFKPEFVSKCANEVQEMLTIDSEDTEGTTDEQAGEAD